jgi:hypothetical protein
VGVSFLYKKEGKKEKKYRMKNKRKREKRKEQTIFDTLLSEVHGKSVPLRDVPYPNA